MTPKDITVFLEQGPAWRERLQYAGHLAAHWQAHLVAVFVVDALEFHPYGSSAIGGGLTEMLHNHMASTQAAEAEIRAAFAAMSSRLGLNGGWYRSDHEWGEGLMLRARYSSLSIIGRSEEHTSELQSLMRISYAVFCLKNKTYKNTNQT